MSPSVKIKPIRMNLKRVDELFTQAKEAQKVAELYEVIMVVRGEVAPVHQKFHELKNNFNMDYEERKVQMNEAMTVIKATETVISFCNDLIDVMKEVEYNRAKEERIRIAQEREEGKQLLKKDYVEKTNFQLAAKKLLPKAVYQSILEIAKDSTQEEIKNKLKGALSVAKGNVAQLLKE